MVQLQNITKTYGTRVLFEDLTLSVGVGEVLGLVGRNGCGKSTLTKIILGHESHDDGQVVVPKGYEIGHLSQHIHFTHPTLRDEVGSVLDELEVYKAEKTLFGLGFEQADLDRDPYDFSGGYQLRINLAKCLVKEPNLLILDEPTNYLDILSIQWMKQVLRSYPGEVLLITHDRSFMDSVVTHTAGLHRGEINKVKGRTSKYYEKLELEEEIHSKTRSNQLKKKKHLEKFVEKYRAKASKASQAQSKLKQIEKLDIADALSDEKTLGFKFAYAPSRAKILLKVQDLAFGFTEEQPLFQNLNFELKPQDRIAVVGKNGKGKTTLLNVLAGDLQKNTGEIDYHPSCELGYYQQTNRKDLDPKLTVEEEIASENAQMTLSEIRSICGAVMFPGDSAKKKIEVLSGGEQSRVLLGKILAHKANLLYLDEPTNHLDMESIDALMEEIERFEGGVLFVTHDEGFLKQVANKLIVFKRGEAKVFNGTYDDFLKKEGWDEEDEGASDQPQKASSNSSLEEKKREFKKEKQRKHIERQIDRLTEDISKLEARVQKKEGELTQDWEKDQKLFEEISKIKKESEDLYKKIEEQLNQLERL